MSKPQLMALSRMYLENKKKIDDLIVEMSNEKPAKEISRLFGVTKNQLVHIRLNHPKTISKKNKD